MALMIALRPRVKWARCDDHGPRHVGPIRGDSPDNAWQGWSGRGTTVPPRDVVLTHHPRESVAMESGTVFQFVTEGVEAALERASLPPTDKTYGSPAASLVRQISEPAWSMGCVWRTRRRCSVAASGSSTISPTLHRDMKVPSSSGQPRRCMSVSSRSPSCPLKT